MRIASTLFFKALHFQPASQFLYQVISIRRFDLDNGHILSGLEPFDETISSQRDRCQHGCVGIQSAHNRFPKGVGKAFHLADFVNHDEACVRPGDETRQSNPLKGRDIHAVATYAMPAADLDMGQKRLLTIQRHGAETNTSALRPDLDGVETTDRHTRQSLQDPAHECSLAYAGPASKKQVRRHSGRDYT